MKGGQIILLTHIEELWWNGNLELQTVPYCSWSINSQTGTKVMGDLYPDVNVLQSLKWKLHRQNAYFSHTFIFSHIILTMWIRRKVYV